MSNPLMISRGTKILSFTVDDTSSLRTIRRPSLAISTFCRYRFTSRILVCFFDGHISLGCMCSPHLVGEREMAWCVRHSFRWRHVHNWETKIKDFTGNFKWLCLKNKLNVKTNCSFTRLRKRSEKIRVNLKFCPYFRVNVNGGTYYTQHFDCSYLRFGPKYVGYS